MKREEHSKIIKDLLTMVSADNQANASELLTQLSDDYEETLTNYETATNSVNDLTIKNERLREVNAELFLKVGTNKKEENENGNGDDNDNGAEKEEMSFDDLFNEKGELI